MNDLHMNDTMILSKWRENQRELERTVIVIVMPWAVQIVYFWCRLPRLVVVVAAAAAVAAVVVVQQRQLVENFTIVYLGDEWWVHC